MRTLTVPLRRFWHSQKRACPQKNIQILLCFLGFKDFLGRGTGIA
jgi:hypothetical protein